MSQFQMLFWNRLRVFVRNQIKNTWKSTSDLEDKLARSARNLAGNVRVRLSNARASDLDFITNTEQ